MINKRGISPLIGTVLIIGFVIILAALVISWGSGFFQKVTERTGEAAEYSLLFSSINVDYETEKITDSEVQITTKNKGNQKVDGFVFTLKSDDKNEVISTDENIVKSTSGASVNPIGVDASLPAFATKVFSLYASVGGEWKSVDVRSIASLPNKKAKVDELDKNIKVQDKILNQESTKGGNEEPQGAICGNGNLETGEECDDGNNVNGDGCSSTCTTETPPAEEPNPETGCNTNSDCLGGLVCKTPLNTNINPGKCCQETQCNYGNYYSKPNCINNGEGITYSGEVFMCYQGSWLRQCSPTKPCQAGENCVDSVCVTSVPTPQLVVVEAESMSLSTFYEEPNSFASGGKVIRLPAGVSQTGTATATFQGITGNYQVKVWYFDENDGTTVYNFEIVTTGEEWTADKVLNSPNADSNTYTFKLIEYPGVGQTIHTINSGATITLTAIANPLGGNEYARVDKIEFIPA